MSIILLLFSDFTLQVVAAGAAILGLVAGALGSFAVLRKQSLLGDSISHAALPGIVIAFMITGSKSPLVMVLGAAIAGWLGTWFILTIIRNTRIDADGAQGIVLSVFFGAGLLLLTYVQKQADASQAGLDKFLFGQAAALLPQDLIIMGVFGGIALILTGLFWKEFKMMTFDPVFGESIGFSAKKVDILLTSLIVISIVIGLQTVGVILMSAMIVAPAAAARQWTDRLLGMVILAGVFGAVSGVTGAVLSSTIPNLPTGPTIVLSLTTLVVFSLLFAPGRGLLATKIVSYRKRYYFSIQKLLIDIYQLESQHSGRGHSHKLETLRLMRKNAGNIKSGLYALAARGLIEKNNQDRWKLTPAGATRALEMVEGETHEI